MSDLIALIEAVENADADTRDEAVHSAMSSLIGRGVGYWDTPEGQRLRPLWDDWCDDLDAIVNANIAELERRMLSNDYPESPWAKGDPFAIYDEEKNDESYEGERALRPPSIPADEQGDNQWSNSLF